MRTLLIPIVLACLPAVAAAQVAGQDTNNPRSNTIAADTASEVAAANGKVAAQAAAQDQVRAAMSANDQARYDADLQAYDAARHARRQTIRHDQAYYEREQRAYAIAMSEWRAQVDACHRGDTRACRAPSPRPGDYM
ncbi:MAG: hypothetical protein ACRYFW_10570 [Janthinobacterium lividum]